MPELLDAVEVLRNPIARAPMRTARLPTTQRVLHIINGEVFSGAERVQQLLGLQLPAFGYDPSFVCIKPGKFAECCDLPAERVWAEPMQHRRDLRVVERIAQRAMKSSIKLIHAHTPRSAMVASAVAKKMGLPWIYHVHSPTVRDSTRRVQNWINDCVERLALQSVQRIITVSKSLRREMLCRGYDRHKVIAIANGVAVQEPIPTEERRDAQHWRLGMVAFIRPRKGIEVLLQAMQRIAVRWPNVHLDVIGGFESEAYRSHIVELTERLGIAHQVHWRGFLRDVQSGLRPLDAMVLPSLFGEGMPMVVLEALAMGIPTIATAVEGTPEVIRDGREGYLAQPQDSDSLAMAIERLISDRDAWRIMSFNAFQRHRTNFTDTIMAQKVGHAYTRTLAEWQPKPMPNRVPVHPHSVLPYAQRFRSLLNDC